MPTIKVHQEVDADPKKTFEKLKKYCDTKLILKEIGNLKPEVEWETKKMSGHFFEKGVEGTITVSSKKPCVITVTMNIPFLMTPFKGLLASSIQHHLDKFA